MKKQVWPDFHHHPRLEESGKLVEFLSDDVAASFSAHGDADAITEQLNAAINCGVPCDILVPHPMPTPHPDGPRPDYMERFANEVLPRLDVRG